MADGGEDLPGQREGRRDATTRQTPPPRQNPFRLLILLSLLLAAVVAYNWIRSKEGQVQVIVKKPVTMRGVEIAKESISFLTSVLTNSGGESFDRKTCDMSKVCVLEGPSTNASKAWKILALSGLLSATGEEEFREALYKEFNNFNPEKRVEDAYSLHQLYWAYRVTRDYELLRYFLVDVLPLADLIRQMPDEAPADGWVSLAAILAKELAFAYEATGDASLRSRFVSSGLMPEDDGRFESKREELLEQSRRVLSVGEQILARQTPGLALSDFPEFRAESCWIPWVKYALYEGTRDSRYLDEVKNFFLEAKLASRGPGELKLVNLQQVLPCAEVLQDLSSHDATFEADLHYLLQDIVVKVWDSRHVLACESDNGFFTITPAARQDQSICADNAKHTSDSSWAIFVLSRYEGLIEVGT